MTRMLAMNVAAVVCLVASCAMAQSTKPTTNPATAALLDQLRQSYSNLKSLQLAGTVSWDADVAQQQEKHSEPFTASFEAPRKFRHEMKDDVLVVGTGEKLFSYRALENQYMTADQPKERGAPGGAGAEMILHDQNPSLLLAMVDDAAGTVADGAVAIDRIADISIDGKMYPALKLTQNDRDIMMAIDPQTGLLRQIQVDVRKIFEQQQVPQVKKALMTIDYTTIEPNAVVDAAKFAFTPPTGATLIDEKAAMEAEGEGDDPSQALVGKPAPAVKLNNLQGKDVSPLEENKGSVIILDFWATWCPPCRKGLPHLAELYKAKQGEGLKVFAVDLREDAEKVQQFLTTQNLDLPVLLDLEGAIANKYLVSGIPQTVLIGKDGKVLKVIVGFDESTVDDLGKAVDAALKAR